MKKIFSAIMIAFACCAVLFISLALFSLGVALFSGRGPAYSQSGACVENTCESCPLANDCVEPPNVIRAESNSKTVLLNPADLKGGAKNFCVDCQLFYACGKESNIDMSDLCLDADPFKLTDDPFKEADESFNSLKASVASESGGYSVRVSGDPGTLEKLSKQLSARFGLNENKNTFCDIAMTGSELVIKINEDAKPGKNEFPF